MKATEANYCELLAQMMFHTGQPILELSRADVQQLRAHLGVGAGVQVDQNDDGSIRLELLNAAAFKEWREGKARD